jgi:hypothetical protein
MSSGAPAAGAELAPRDAAAYHAVAPGLLIGPAPTMPMDVLGLVGAVLDLRETEHLHTRFYGAIGIAYRRCGFPDGGPLPPAKELDSAVAWVREQRAAGVTVLVHCHAGRSRSPFVAALVLAPEHGGGGLRALAQVRAQHPPTDPLEPFLAHLRTLGPHPSAGA